MCLRVLIVDDDPQIRRALRIALVAQGFTVDEARGGEEAIQKLREDPADVVLLDLIMPGIGGIAVCREIRAVSEVPIVVVSGRASAKDCTEAFEAGVDHYISKPADVRELVASIRAVHRRAAPKASTRLVLGEVEVDLQTHDVRRQGQTVHLTDKEFRLLRCFASHPERCCPTAGFCRPSGAQTTGRSRVPARFHQSLRVPNSGPSARLGFRGLHG